MIEPTTLTVELDVHAALGPPGGGSCGGAVGRADAALRRGAGGPGSASRMPS